MFLHIVLSITAFMVHGTSAQFGSCTFSDINNFTMGQSASCGPTILAVLIPGEKTPQQLEAALNTFCHVNCGEVFVEYLILQCGSPGLAFALHSYCLPTRNTSNFGGYCQHSVPGRVDLSVINSVAACSEFPVQGSCIIDCAAGLAALRNAFGCCYQNIYNTTGVLEGYRQENLISQENVTLYQNIVSNYSLWSECNVTQVTQCTGDPFAGRSSGGSICTQEQVDAHIATRSETCQGSIPFVLANFNNSLITPTTFDNLCTRECVGSFSDFLSNTCRDEFSGLVTKSACLKSNGSLSNRCSYSFSFPSSPDGSDAAVCFSEGNTCPPGCASFLQRLSSDIGCCYQSIFNNSIILDALFITNEGLGFQSLLFFKVLGNYKLWESCGVSLVSECEGDGFVDDTTTGSTAGAVKLGVPIAVWILTLIVTIFLH